RSDPALVLELANFCAAGSLPQPNRSVVTGRGQGLAVRGVDNRPDRTMVPVELAKFFAAGRLPQPDGLVVTGGSQGLAVRRADNRPDRPLVPARLATYFPPGAPLALELANVGGGGSLPQPNRLVVAGRGQGLAIRKINNRPDRILVPEELANFFVAGCRCCS